MIIKKFIKSLVFCIGASEEVCYLHYCDGCVQSE